VPVGPSNSRTCSKTTVRSDAEALEIDPQRGVEQALKGLILFLNHWVEASVAFALKVA